MPRKRIKRRRVNPAYRKHMAKVRRGIRSGRFATECATFTRRYCFTKKGHKTTSCSTSGHTTKTRSVSRCRDRHNGKFTIGAHCGPASRCSTKR
jgi:hypothetical protein